MAVANVSVFDLYPKMTMQNWTVYIYRKYDISLNDFSSYFDDKVDDIDDAAAAHDDDDDDDDDAKLSIIILFEHIYFQRPIGARVRRIKE